MTTLRTERLLLRMFREEDLDAYASMCADPEVVRFIGNPFTRAESWRHMAMLLGHWQLRGFGMWAVEELETRSMIGRIGFFQPEGWPGFELGWVLAREYWGRGFATEGAAAALNFGFTELRSPHLISLIRPQNRSSIRVAEKLGEKLEGRSEILGVEALVYGISRDSWAAR